VIALAFVSGSLRLSTLSEKQSIIHDEAVSLMAAAGKLKSFSRVRRKFANQWVSGSAWRDQIEIDKPWNFREIGTELARFDLHPPLYFWLLHVAGLVSGGLSPRTGGAANTLLHVLGMLAMFSLVKRTTRQAGWALLPVGVWSFASTTIATTYVARQYELLGVIGITAALLLVRLFGADRRHWLWAALLALTLGAGLLTHAQGVLLLGTVGVAAGLGLTEHFVRRRRAVPHPFHPIGPLLALAACPLAGALMLLAHPLALEQFANLAGRDEPRTDAAFEQRWTKSASTLTSMFDQADLGQHHPTAVFVALGLLCLVPLCVALVQFLRARDEDQAAGFGGAALVMLFACAASAGTFGSYVAFMSVRHAMEARYIALASPFLAMSLAYTGWLLRPRLPLFVAVPLLAMFAALGWGWRANSPYLCEGRAYFSPELALAKTVVIDNSARGYLGVLLVHLRPDARVFVANGAEVRTHGKKILTELENVDSATFVHMAGQGVSNRDGKSLFALAGSAKMQLWPSGRLAALLERDEDLLVLLVGRGDLRRLLRNPELKALKTAGSSLRTIPRGGASSWLIHGGRVIAEQTAEDASLTLAGASAGKTNVPFSVDCGEDACEAGLGTARATLSNDGLWVLVWSVSAAKPLLVTRLAANAEATSPGETKFGIRSLSK